MEDWVIEYNSYKTKMVYQKKKKKLCEKYAKFILKNEKYSNEVILSCI